MELKILIVAAAFSLSSSAFAGDYRAGLRGINIDPENPWANPPAESVRRLGLTGVRFVYKADHGRMVEAAQKYAGAGLTVTLVLNNETVDMLGVSWPPSDSQAWEEYASTYLRAAGEAARRLRGLGDKVAYQLWNEQNIEGSYVPAERFGPLARRAADLLRAAHPGARVVLGSLVHNDDAVAYLEASLRAEEGLFDSIDQLGVHTYGDLSAFPRELARAYGRFDKPLALTEWGECGRAPAQAGAAMRGYLEALDGLALVSEAHYFSWSESQAPGCGFGLSEPLDGPGVDGQPYRLKPGMPWVFRGTDWTAWERVDPDVRLLFEATYGARAQEQWEEEHARDRDTPGWRGAEFPEIEDLRGWADWYRKSG